MDLFNIEQNYQLIKNKFVLLLTPTQLKSLKEEIDEIEEAMMQPDFYSNQSKVKELTSKLGLNKNIITTHNDISDNLDSLEEYISLLKEEADLNLFEEVSQLSSDLLRQYATFETKILLDDEYDQSDAIIEIHSGAGGTESQDWVEMLYKMYIAYAKRNTFKIDLININTANDVGLKSVTFQLSGSFAYGLLKNEKGVHRLIRISPFDSSSKRHTTFASVSVSPYLDNDIEFKIEDSDLNIETYRSSGAGGQSVNTTDSAVRITHIPSKIVVTCQNERSQLQNKQIALGVLNSKLLALKIQEDKAKIAQIKGVNLAVDFGSQIRSYVFHPYAMVKDHRSNYESSNPSDVLSGKLDDIINSVLQVSKEG